MVGIELWVGGECFVYGDLRRPEHPCTNIDALETSRGWTYHCRMWRPIPNSLHFTAVLYSQKNGWWYVTEILGGADQIKELETQFVNEFKVKHHAHTHTLKSVTRHAPEKIPAALSW